MTKITEELRDCGTAVAINDAILSGWFNLDSGELYRGFQIGAEDRVLDVGCGDGGYVAFCSRFSPDITCMDIDGTRLRNTCEKLRPKAIGELRAVVGDSMKLPLADACATRIICTEVLEHVDDPAPVFSELARVGSPGALYLITVPDPASEALQGVVAPPVYFEKPNHIRVFSREDFPAQVRAAGLEILEQQSFSFYQSMWLALFWACGCDISDRSHPLLQSWDRTWELLMQTPQAATAKHALDATLPKTQLILARKAG